MFIQDKNFSKKYCYKLELLELSIKLSIRQVILHYVNIIAFAIITPYLIFLALFKFLQEFNSKIFCA